MSLKLFIDEDTQDKVLVKLLRQANHKVTTVNEANLMGQPDVNILNYATNKGLVLVTLNCRDFQILHEKNSTHFGILAIYQEANPLKNMSFKAIIKAIYNLEIARVPIAHQFICLNQWNY